MSKCSNYLILNQIFRSAINAVLPRQLIRSSIRIENDQLLIQNGPKKLHRIKIIDRDIFLFGAGKAIIGMCQGFLEQIDQSKISNIRINGHLNIPFASVIEDRFLFSKYNTFYYECAKNNLPDDFSVKNSKNLMYKLHKHVTSHPNPLIIGFISGGGSALLSMPNESITLQEKLNVINTLVKYGANIVELNSIRGCLSQVKHGKLAQKIFNWNPNTELVTFIISDIIGDPVEMIASGPTVFPTICMEPNKVLQKYSIKFEDKIIELINNEQRKKMPTEINLTNILIGNNSIALNQARKQAENLGFKVIMLGSGLSGEAVSIIQKFLNEIRNHKISDEDYVKYKGIIWIAGGEVTINMNQATKTTGIGGRCQEMGLLFLDEMNKINMNDKEIHALFAGTDGQDGPTNAAGVVLKWPFKYDDNKLQQSLHNHDSYNFWKENAPECLLNTGITGTNVMDIYLMMIKFEKNH